LAFDDLVFFTGELFDENKEMFEKNGAIVLNLPSGKSHLEVFLILERTKPNSISGMSPLLPLKTEPFSTKASGYLTT